MVSAISDLALDLGVFALDNEIENRRTIVTYSASAHEALQTLHTEQDRSTQKTRSEQRRRETPGRTIRFLKCKAMGIRIAKAATSTQKIIRQELLRNNGDRRQRKVIDKTIAI
jgi:hypothetical protein